MVIADGGNLLYDLPLPGTGNDQSAGKGLSIASFIRILVGHRQLETMVQTFDHGMDVFTVSGSAEICLIWPHRLLKMGQLNSGV